MTSLDNLKEGDVVTNGGSVARKVLFVLKPGLYLIDWGYDDIQTKSSEFLMGMGYKLKSEEPIEMTADRAFDMGDREWEEYINTTIRIVE